MTNMEIFHHQILHCLAPQIQQFSSSKSDILEGPKCSDSFPNSVKFSLDLENMYYTPWKINILNPKIVVWFRWCSFSSVGDFYVNQPLIFPGCTKWRTWQCLWDGHEVRVFQKRILSADNVVGGGEIHGSWVMLPNQADCNFPSFSIG